MLKLLSHVCKLCILNLLKIFLTLPFKLLLLNWFPNSLLFFYFLLIHIMMFFFLFINLPILWIYILDIPSLTPNSFRKSKHLMQPFIDCYRLRSLNHLCFNNLASDCMVVTISKSVELTVIQCHSTF